MPQLLDTIQGQPVYQYDFNRVTFIGDADIDADGMNGQSGPDKVAYRPDNHGFEHLGNAGYPDHPEWYTSILLCHELQPVRQSADSLSPGAFISKTAYEWRHLDKEDPSRWVDSFSVPYIVVPSGIRKKAKGVVLGCRAQVTYKGKIIPCGVLDIGPARKVGEVSIALAREMGIDYNPRNGGIDTFNVKYEFWPGEPFGFAGRTYDLIPA